MERDELAGRLMREVGLPRADRGDWAKEAFIYRGDWPKESQEWWYGPEWLMYHDAGMPGEDRPLFMCSRQVQTWLDRWWGACFSLSPEVQMFGLAPYWPKPYPAWALAVARVAELQKQVFVQWVMDGGLQ